MHFAFKYFDKIKYRHYAYMVPFVVAAFMLYRLNGSFDDAIMKSILLLTKSMRTVVIFLFATPDGLTLQFIAYTAILCLAFRSRPFSEDFELNPIYHTPPSGISTPIKPYEDIVLTIEDIRRTMQLATILAKPDYELAKNPEKYKNILNSPIE